MTVPGFTTAAQYSTSPLPVPMRVSAGFFDTDLCGNTRIQNLASGAMRDAATRPASMPRAGSQPGSIACRPYSPNDTSVPRVALPRILPRICLRHLVRLGINMVQRSDGVFSALWRTGSRPLVVSPGPYSPLKIQTLQPIEPYLVLQIAKP